MSDEKIVLKVQIGNFSVEVTGSVEYAEKKLDDLIQKYDPSHRKDSHTQTTTTTNAARVKPLSPSEFITKVSPKNQSERALVLAHYLEKVKNMESFNTADLTEIDRVAKQPKFTNISDTVAKLVQQGQLMGAGEREGKRVFVLTTTGEEYVENLLKSKQE